ncbi:MAG: DUF4160 domain-containing protein [Alphaproteobacteria bacterium]
MPTISVFFGIVVQMYYRDHPPPHVHAIYQGFEALVEIETGAIIGGRLPGPAALMMRDWVVAHRSELTANWARCRMLQPLEKVPGADLE